MRETEFKSMLPIMHNTTCPFTGILIKFSNMNSRGYPIIKLCIVFTNLCLKILCDRHGLKQYRNGWADGPAYITQCPIQTGNSYLYDFNVTGQRGTLWWHAHILWLRATVYGAIVIMPDTKKPFPFPQPEREEIILLGKPY